LLFASDTEGWLRLSICLLCCSDSGALHLHDVSDLGDIDKLVDEPLTVHFGQDAPLVVIPECSSHRLVVHVGLVLVHAPQPGHRFAVHQLEDALLPVGPLDELGTTLFVLKQFEQKLPEIGGASLAGFSFKWYSIRSNLGCSMFLFLEFKRVLIRGKSRRMIR